MSNDLPPLSGPVDASGEPACSVCQVRTLYACADCRIDFGVSIPVCSKPTCRDEHEQKCSARLRERLAGAAVPSSPAQPSMVDALKDAVQTARNYYMLFHEDVWKARLTKWEAALPPSSPVADNPTKEPK